jgi:N-sulfoglucosamine sulfohydrolase
MQPRFLHFCLFSALSLFGRGLFAEPEPMHFIFITLDDLSRESIGIHGCSIPEISPHMDSLALSGLRFEHMHVQAANCTPSRNIMSSGLYQQHNKVFSLGDEGAGNHETYPALPDVFRDAGYHTGVMGKNSHMSPFEPYSGFDVIYDGYSSTREPDNIHEKLTQAFADAAAAGKPLYFNLNIFDPHTRWYGWNHKEGKVDNERNNHPSRIYTAEEIPYPSWFPPLSEAERILPSKDGTETHSMMVELAAYYNTAKRADDSVGKAIKAIEDAGATANTIIVLVSDHGVQLPGAKTQLYDHSTRSPLFVVWPGVTSPGTVNKSHMIASIDLLPTFAEMIGQPIPADLDGRSFAPIIRGETEPRWRDYVYKQQNDRNKMRALQTTELLYIFNPWSDGSDKVGTVATGMHSWRCIVAAGEAGNAEAAAYANFFLYRSVEELYDMTVDPDCLINLVDDPDYADELAEMRVRMEQVMIESGDDLVLPAFRNRSDPQALKDFLSAQSAYQGALGQDPNYLRNVFYDPHDDWMEIGHDMFEAATGWGIWEAGSAGVGLGDGKDEGAGSHAGRNMVIFDSSVADQSRIMTQATLDTSALERLKLDLHVDDADTGVFDNGASLKLQYDDGSGWKTFPSISIGSTGDKNEICQLSGGGLPDSLRFGILCDFGGASGKVYLDDLRLTGWQDWKPHPTDTAFNATKLAAVRLSFEFETTNFGEDDRLLLEYHDGSAWTLLKAYDFGYVLLEGKRYHDVVDLDPTNVVFSNAMQFRFRSEQTDAGQDFDVSNFEIKSRNAVRNTAQAVDDSYSEPHPKGIVVTGDGVLGNDNGGEGVTMSVRLIRGPGHGILEFNHDGSFVYAPLNGYTGTDSFTYIADNGLETSREATVTLTIHAASGVLSSFSEWAALHGVDENEARLLRYAFNINPHLSASYPLVESGNSGLPVWKLPSVSPDSSLSVQFVRRKHAADLQYLVEFSNNLNEWDPGAGESVENIDGDFERVTVEDGMSTREAGQRFGRVVVSRDS